MIVGLTGGIGSGKSTVAQMFRELGVAVYNSDEAAKTLMVTSDSLRKEIIQLLGESSYIGKNLNRSYISEQVFNNAELLEKLNQIVHPAVKSHFKEWVSVQKSAYVIQETALIFENDAAGQYDAIVVVNAPQSTRIERVMKRDGSSKEQIKSRMQHQLPEEDKIKHADYVIQNTTLKDTKKQLVKIHRELLSKSQ